MKKSIGAETIIYRTLVLVVGTNGATGKTTSAFNLATAAVWVAETSYNLIHRRYHL